MKKKDIAERLEGLESWTVDEIQKLKDSIEELKEKNGDIKGTAESLIRAWELIHQLAGRISILEKKLEQPEEQKGQPPIVSEKTEVLSKEEIDYILKATGCNKKELSGEQKPGKTQAEEAIDNMRRAIKIPDKQDIPEGSIVEGITEDGYKVVGYKVVGYKSKKNIIENKLKMNGKTMNVAEWYYCTDIKLIRKPAEGGIEI